MSMKSSEDSAQEVKPDDGESCLLPIPTQDLTISGDGFGDAVDQPLPVSDPL